MNQYQLIFESSNSPLCEEISMNCHVTWQKINQHLSQKLNIVPDDAISCGSDLVRHMKLSVHELLPQRWSIQLSFKWWIPAKTRETACFPNVSPPIQEMEPHLRLPNNHKCQRDYGWKIRNSEWWRAFSWIFGYLWSGYMSRDGNHHDCNTN